MIIIAADCSEYITVLLSSKGEVLSCGDYRYNGNGDLYNNLYEPKVIESLQKSENIKSIASGRCHTLCLNEKNKILIFGEKDLDEPHYIEYFVDNEIDIGLIYASERK